MKNHSKYLHILDKEVVKSCKIKGEKLIFNILWKGISLRISLKRTVAIKI